MNDTQLSMQERWAMDDAYAKKYGELFKIATPQCEMCRYWIKGNAEQCERFHDIKPKETLRCKKECPAFEHKDKLELHCDTGLMKQILGGVLGFTVADSLGVPVEFSSREERQTDPVEEMRAYGTYHQYFGTWSDDSSLTFCLMDSLKNGYNLQKIADNFCKFYYEGFWTPNNEVFDIGNATAQAIEKMKNGVKPIECGGNKETDNGNGSLMRVLPLAFYLLNGNKGTKEKIKIIEDVSSLTHAHKRSKLACIIYIEFIENLLLGCNKHDSYSNMKNFIAKNIDAAYITELECYRNILKNDISQVSEEHIHSSGYVVHSIEAAFWSFLTSESYNEAVFKAINLGSDTDTIGAITGSMAGIYYGLTSISENWIQCLARKEDIYELCNDFSIVCG